MFDIRPIFCTYFKKLEHFQYECEVYGEYVAFCVKSGAFYYQIEQEKEYLLSEGEFVICPPDHCFNRRIKITAEICMIKFELTGDLPIVGKKIKASNIMRFNDDLKKLEACLFCYDLPKSPLFSHYCADIIYLAINSVQIDDGISNLKKYIDQNYTKELYISELAKEMGYTPAHLINKFRAYYEITPKAYLSHVRLLKAKELLLTTDLLSREIAYALGFKDELYFIRFFKKRTGTTPKQFRKQGI